MLSLLPLLQVVPMLTMVGVAQMDARVAAPLSSWLRKFVVIVADSYHRAFPVELFGSSQSKTVPVIWTERSARSSAPALRPPARRSTSHRFRTARAYMGKDGGRRTTLTAERRVLGR